MSNYLETLLGEHWQDFFNVEDYFYIERTMDSECDLFTNLLRYGSVEAKDFQ